MRIGKRNLGVFLRRLKERENYSAAARMVTVHENPLGILGREVFSRGTYPCSVSIRTPLGPRSVHLFHPEDLSTLNLIFCRRDYLVPSKLDVVVDIGTNIGLSALYWLTRNATCRAYLHEPVPRNVERLRQNLAGLEERYDLRTSAVSDSRGEVSFGIEETGKLGGIGVPTERSIRVQCVHVMDVLTPILERHGTIDCLKVDTEGQELPILRAISPNCWDRIRCLNVDDLAAAGVVPLHFVASRRGSALRFTNPHLS